ncbi:MAG TPA: flavodoxin-dependent (E)-4-hydroxy-3-methylbut-2-enyl-diphosphate synthase [Candidatus Hydrogenedentes bacterium]|nr:flavodoxin-dependent (E)-4-hydroxy-3-methylbut-2-enyl-diphosphate synthase [Candidatus Hydrogenedentota bacterium]HPC14928.1 flavodoxin-dependent (E)-4-hydroxy-3-methylbut-2-enyl-diphosphate synthase [Candidatus Hydrogenedentota bacterium]HRT18792.1 flavodoxin-dependent (E)-4-hydroxy-3-methylbut-2-enyl-diphosphate synthase [Candidatus Hydrogenedentota bacterium]HRT65762.1 flavodoxin-dependent (E)-4-hydroxy-3-methylbut-2-enyl-diphosphate synthase [Candidatus Hydrogenedentota bacterium]
MTAAGKDNGYHRHNTVAVPVGGMTMGGGAPIVVQTMTNTDTVDVAATARQIIELAEAGSELVRVTVNTHEAASGVGELVRRVRDAGCMAAIAGDFHYNGHVLLREFPECASALDKYRINPGNVGAGRTRDAHFTTICRIAADHGKPVRIGVNAGSLNPDLVEAVRRENIERDLGRSPDDMLNECMIRSALDSTELALKSGLGEDRIVISCKSSSPRHLIRLYRDLARATRQPLHLGLTEAGMGLKGLVWSAASMAVLLEEGIGDTIRVSLTPRPGGDRREEAYAACELLQALGLRSFSPTITACPGCGRTAGALYQRLAEQTEAYVRARLPEWRRKHPGVETMTIAVMGCIVNGPGESKAANVGISLPGNDEEPHCPVFIDGLRTATLSGTPEEIGAAFRGIIDTYVATRYSPIP